MTPEEKHLEKAKKRAEKAMLKAMEPHKDKCHCGKCGTFDEVFGKIMSESTTYRGLR